MRLTLNFVKKNALEMLRDPVVYVFCLGFPVVMLVVFQIINSATGGSTPMFDIKSLVPAMITFAFTFVMLVESLAVSKDRRSAFLIRLYTSPMKTAHFVLGYSLPCVAVGLGQTVVCIACGGIIAAIIGTGYFSFGAAMLLIVQSMPMLFINIFFGIFFGSTFGERSAPAISSVFISAGGLLSGAWMPLEAMGGFQSFCRFLPFYPSVYIGRVTTGAEYLTAAGGLAPYTFDGTAKLGFIPIVLFLVIGFGAAAIAFWRNMHTDKR